MTSTSTRSLLRDSVNGKGSTWPFVENAGSDPIARRAPEDRIEQAVAEVVIGLVGERRPLPLARKADALPHLEVHEVRA